MKKLNYVKFLIDLIMVLVFTLLFNKMAIGIKLHEIIGLVIGGVVLIHCGLNFKWIKSVTLKFFNKNISIKTRIGYILDVILLINILVIIISGIFISKVVFSGLRLSSIPFFKMIHIPASYFILMIIGIHLGLHWNWAMLVFKKIFKIPEKKIFTYISKLIVMLVLLFGIYSFNSVGYISKISFRSSHRIENSMVKDFNNNENKKAMQNNISKGKGKFEEGNAKGKDGEKGNTNIFRVISLHLGVISLFSIITYYLEKLIRIRKKVA